MSEYRREFLSELQARIREMLGAMAALMRPQRSLTGRLMLAMLLTTAIALVVASAVLLITDVRDTRQRWADDLAIEADILALSVTPALSFDDRAGARRSLVALQARAPIQIAALYAADGSLYAVYRRAATQPLPARIPSLTAGVHITDDRIELVRPIVQNGERLGAIYMYARHDIAGRVLAYASVVGVVMLLSFAVALLASGWLQQTITRPMDDITAVAREVIERSDYTARARSSTADELGVVVGAFNRMLDEVQSRERALSTSNAALTEQIAVRRQAEHALQESEKLYRAIGESINFGVWVCDASGRNTYASDSFLQLVGLTQTQCSVLGWADILHPEDRDATIAAWAECVRTGNPWYREHRMRGADGQYHAILAQGVPIRDDRGEITGWAGINLDIARLKQTEEALREADQRKDEFLATLAHELRNPLAPVRNAVRILEMPNIDQRQRDWCREVIARQVRNMALLLDDLLDVSRITRGKLELRKEHVMLSSVIDGAVETARPVIEAKQHAFNLELPAIEPTLEVDALRISQIIANLLNNAAKYTDAGGEIVLRAETSADGLTISVTDNGIGLAADTVPIVFGMFAQIDTGIDRAQGGLGIGLSLVKGLTELHGGTVEARSAGLGRGSEFRVRLPASALVARTSSASPPVVTQDAASGIGTVLIVDDNRAAAESLAMMLELAGYDTLCAFSGAQALEVAARERVDVALLDIGMPGMSGYELAQRFRETSWGRGIALIAITGWGQEDDKQQSRAAGFDEHLTKPVDTQELERILLRYLRAAELA